MLACATDYDVWNRETDDVSVEGVIANLQQNVATSSEILRLVIPSLPEEGDCPAQRRFRTPSSLRPTGSRRRLEGAWIS